jgi:transcriptional regulator with XRE-family HTH domain
MPDTIELSLGRLLKGLRQAKRLSLRDVQNRGEISNAYLSQLENDMIRKPSPHVLHKLADLYSVDYNYLMRKAGYFVAAASPRRGHNVRSRSFALSAMKDLLPEEEDALLEYLAFLRTRERRRR